MTTKLSQQAQEALCRIQALRETLGNIPSAIRAEAKILENITLREVADVALALQEWEAAENEANNE